MSKVESTTTIFDLQTMPLDRRNPAEEVGGQSALSLTFCVSPAELADVGGASNVSVVTCGT